MELIEKSHHSLTEGRVLIVGGFVSGLARHSAGCDISELFSEHEEADTRMLLHDKHASREGYSRWVCVYDDMDILVLLLSHKIASFV